MYTRHADHVYLSPHPNHACPSHLLSTNLSLTFMCIYCDPLSLYKVICVNLQLSIEVIHK